jgi:hypothetical protein
MQKKIPAKIEKELLEYLEASGILGTDAQDASRLGVQWLLNRKENRTFYADGVDYQHEIGETDARIYASKAQTLEENPRSEDCGIVKCLLVPLEWVKRQDLRGYKKKAKH